MFWSFFFVLKLEVYVCFVKSLLMFCFYLSKQLKESPRTQNLGVKPLRQMAENGFAPPPLGNFADISYLVENRKPNLLRHVCSLCTGALVCKSLYHMLLYQIMKK